MPKRFPPEVRSIAGELAYTGLDSAEITRRLQRNEAGLGYKVDISYRRVREYVAEYEAEHGPPPDPDEIDHTSDSIARLKRRIVAVVSAEIVRYESKRRPKLKASDVPALQRLYAALDDFERRTANAEHRERKRKRRGRGKGGDAAPSKPESILERMAREQREASAAAPPSPDDKPDSTPDTGAPNEWDTGSSADSAQPAAEPSSGPDSGDITSEEIAKLTEAGEPGPDGDAPSRPCPHRGEPEGPVMGHCECHAGEEASRSGDEARAAQSDLINELHEPSRDPRRLEHLRRADAAAARMGDLKPISELGKPLPKTTAISAGPTTDRPGCPSPQRSAATSDA